MTTTVHIGSVEFVDVNYPLVVGDRYFHFETTPLGRLQADVFRWAGPGSAREYEVRAGEPIAENIEKSHNGTVVVAREDGGFLYKIRPDSETSHLFGSVPGDEGWEVRVRDKRITVRLNGQELGGLGDMTIDSVGIGLAFTFDGSQTDVQVPPKE